MDLNTLGGNATASGFSWTGGNIKTSFSQHSDKNISDFGTFNVVLDDFGGYTSAIKTLSFSLTDNSSTTWSTALGVLTPDNKDFLAAGHIFVQDTTNTTCAVVTGYAGNGPTRVSEPSLLMLLGSGLIGLGLFIRKKFKR